MQVLTVDFKLLKSKLHVLTNPTQALFIHIFQASASTVSFTALAENCAHPPAPQPQAALIACRVQQLLLIHSGRTW